MFSCVFVIKAPPKLNCTFSQEPDRKLESPPKRLSIKRKLYPQSSQESDSNQSSSLNETITIKTCFNADAINSTFCLQEKGPVPKKKTVLSDRSNKVCAENLLPKGEIFIQILNEIFQELMQNI